LELDRLVYFFFIPKLNWFGSVWPVQAHQNQKPNRTGYFPKYFNQFNRFCLSFRFFRLIFFRFSRLNRFSGFFAHPYFLPLSLPACSAKTQSPMPPYNEKPGGHALQSTPIGHLAQRRGRAGRPRSPCAMIGRGWGRPRSPLPYKYHSQHQHKRRGKRKGKKRDVERREREMETRGEEKKEKENRWKGFEREKQGRAGSTKGENA